MNAPKRGTVFFILFSLWLLVFAASSQVMMITPLLGTIGEELAIEKSLLGILAAAYSMSLAVFALIMGPVSDKIGRRRILLIGTGFMSISLALHPLAVDFFSFFVLRVMAGAAGGVLSGAAVAYVGDYFPYEKRGRANGVIMSGSAAGQIAGIPLGTFLAGLYNFQLPFLMFGVFMSFAFLLILFTVPQPNVQREKAKITFKNTLLKYWSMLQRGEVMAASAAYFLMFLSIAVFVFFLPLWLEETFGVDHNEIALLFLFGGVANLMTGPLAGWTSDLVGRKMLVIISCVGLSILMFCTTFIITDPMYAYPLFFITMVLVAMRISPFQALLCEIIPAEERGSLLSLMIALGQVGFGIGGIVSGPAYTIGGFFWNSVLGSVMILMMALIVWRFLPEPELKKVAA